MIDQIKTAIASYGMSGQVFHGPLIKVNSGFQLEKVFERSKNNSKIVFPNARIVRNYEEILSDNSIELIIVNTPDLLHFEMAKQALEAGKHVIVEKPFTRTSAEAEKLIQIARKNNLVLSVFHNRRWDSDFLTIKKVLENNWIGRLIEFESHFDRYRNFLVPDTWKEKETNFTGSLYNLGSHMVDQVLVLFGEPIEITAHLRKNRTDTKIFDYYDIRLQYDQFAAILKCSLLVREPGPRYIMNGTLGSFIKYGFDPQEAKLKTGILPQGKDWGIESPEQHGLLNTEINGVHFRGTIDSEAGNYNLFYNNIYDAIRNKSNLLVSPEEAKTVIKILELAILSDSERKTIPFK